MSLEAMKTALDALKTADVCEECGAIVDGLNPLDCASAIRERGKE
jgi:hypothetical protein